MKKLFTTILLLMFLKLCVAQSISGTYQTAWGEMTLHQSGNQITGTYKHNNGQIKGTLDGTTLTGTWTQNNGKGRIIFEFNDEFTSFSGKWSYNDAEPTSGQWNGIKEVLIKVNVSGDYSTKWGDMTLRQSGNQVTGSYKLNNGKISGTLTGKVLTGTWTQTNAKGRIRFEFNDDLSSFTGKWSYNDAEPTSGDWDGKKK